MMRGHRTLFTAVTLVVLIGSLVVTSLATGQTPRRGGILLAAIGADAPGLDPHQEQTFATLQPTAPLYSTLLQIEPGNYPNVVGDLATEWKISPDGLTYTFKLHKGVKSTTARRSRPSTSRRATTRSSTRRKV
jgi:ABC-type transport system substrate-binding protein